MDKVTGQCVHKPQPFRRERRAEAVSNRGPSAYQPNALPLGQTRSLEAGTQNLLILCIACCSSSFPEGSFGICVHNHNFYSEFPRLAVVQVSMYWPQAEDSKKRLCVTPEGGMQAVPEWLLETEGSNLLRVLSDPEVDTRKTSTNHIVEIFSVSCASAVSYTHLTLPTRSLV